MKPIRLFRSAQREMVEAAEFYESRRTGLGIEFALELESAVEDIAEHPERWPRLHGDARRRLLRRFPYSVIYSEFEEEIVIVAVMHQSREPGYWADRQDEI